MTEIELKAHVDKREALVQRLSAFARYEGRVVRDDEYFAPARGDRRTLRIRRERFAPGTARESSCCLVTYKRRSLSTDGRGTTVEVNDERECTVSDPDALLSFLADTGFVSVLRKHKDVEDWSLDLPAGSVLPCPLSATFELCAVPPLGDFLEIEILSPAGDDDSVAKVRASLSGLLLRAGIPASCIEERSYRELLEQAAAKL